MFGWTLLPTCQNCSESDCGEISVNSLFLSSIGEKNNFSSSVDKDFLWLQWEPLFLNFGLFHGPALSSQQTPFQVLRPQSWHEQSREMSQIWRIYPCKYIDRLGINFDKSSPFSKIWTMCMFVYKLA